jgi:hypothetical protein
MAGTGACGLAKRALLCEVESVGFATGKGVASTDGWEFLCSSSVIIVF